MILQRKEIKILFLCTELAGYFVNCIRTLKSETVASIKVVHWPVAASAPFHFEPGLFDTSDKSKLSTEQLRVACLSFNPEIVYVAGWADKDYLKLARELRRNGAVVVGGLDNAWRGSLKQRMSTAMSSWLVKPYFDYLWVAGHRQYQFAQRLRYSHDRILTGIYVADINRFDHRNKQSFKKELLYVGRFEKEKGVELLVEAFASLTDKERNGWILRMIGNGSLRGKIKSGPDINVQDFLQPEALVSETREAGGFILPSLDEPWGVVVQEFAAAGLPLLLSNQVNAGEKFLIHHYNGFVFDSGSIPSLKAVLIRYFQLTPHQIASMGERSHELAFTITPQLWAARLISVLKESNT